MKLTIVGVVVFALSSSAYANHCAYSTAPSSKTAPKDRVDWVMKKERNHKFFTGAIVAVIDLPKSFAEVLYYGSPRSSGDTPTPTTAYRIGSVTKTFTATLLALFGSRGYLKVKTCPGNAHPVTSNTLAQTLLNRVKVGKCTLPSPRDQIDVEDLATHYAGLPKVPTRKVCSIPDLYQDLCTCEPDATGGSDTAQCATGECPPESPCKSGGGSCGTCCGYSKNECPVRAPHVKVEYSNLGFDFLSHLLVQVDPDGGDTWAHTNREHLLKPLGMTQTFTDTEGPPSGITKGMAYHGCNANSGCIADGGPYPAPNNGAGALWQTGRDMLFWLAANVRGIPQIKPDPPVQEILDIIPETQCERHGDATLGWFTDTLDSDKIITKDGSWASFRSYIAYSPKKLKGVFVSVNSNDDGEPCNGIGDLGQEILHNLP